MTSSASVLGDGLTLFWGRALKEPTPYLQREIVVYVQMHHYAVRHNYTDEEEFCCCSQWVDSLIRTLQHALYLWWCHANRIIWEGKHLSVVFLFPSHKSESIRCFFFAWNNSLKFVFLYLTVLLLGLSSVRRIREKTPKERRKQEPASLNKTEALCVYAYERWLWFLRSVALGRMRPPTPCLWNE